jgi:hypothetical protein
LAGVIRYESRRWGTNMAQRAGEKSREAGISGRRWWNLCVKPGFDVNVFWNVAMSNGIFDDSLVS